MTTITPTVVLTITPTATITPTPTSTPLPANVLTSSNCPAINVQARIGDGHINKMLYSPDGAYLLIGSADSIELYDTNQAKLLWSDITTNGISDVAMDTKRQTILALDTKNTLHLIDMKSGKELNSAKQGDQFMALALTDDGQELAAADFDGIIHQYDTKNFDEQGTIRGPARSPGALFADSVYFFMKYSPDKKYIAFATLRAEIYVYNTANGNLVHRIKPLSPDFDNRIFPNHITFSQDGKTLAVGYENGQTLVVKTIGTQPGKLLEGSSPSLSIDGSTVALKTKRGVELFQTSTGNSLGLVDNTQTALGDSMFSPNGKNLSVITSGEIMFWNIKEQTVDGSVQAAFSDYQAIAISQGGTTLAAASHQLIDLFQVKNGAGQTLTSDYPVQFLQFAAENSILVAAGSAQLSIWNMAQSKVTSEIKLPENIQSMSVSTDGKNAVVVTDTRSVLSYDLSTGQGRAINQPEDKFTSAVFIGSSATILALNENGQVYLSTTEHPELTKLNSKQLSIDNNPLVTFASSADGITSISIYDSVKHKILDSDLGIPGPAALSPVNHIIAVPDTENSIITITDAKNNEKSCKIKDFSIGSRQMLFSPNGQFLFFAGDNGIVYILGTSTKSLND